MKVLRVNSELDKIQNILPAEDYEFEVLSFNGQPKLEGWTKKRFFVFNPLKKRKNFFILGSDGGALAMDEKAAIELAEFWSLAGELLPIYLETGEELFILNVLEVCNCLDQERTKFDYYSDGTRGRVLAPVFHIDRWPESSIFKIPELIRTHVLTYVDVKGSEDEFYTAYKNSGLSGLRFEEMFSSETF